MPSYRNKVIYVIVRHYFDGENKQQSLVNGYNTEIRAREEAAKLILVNRNSSIGIETVTLVDE